MLLLRKVVLSTFLRQIVSWIGIRELGYSGAEVVRYLGVTTSCVNRFISTGKKPDMDLNHIS